MCGASTAVSPLSVVFDSLGQFIPAQHLSLRTSLLISQSQVRCVRDKPCLQL